MAPADAPAPRQPDTPTPRHPDKAWLRSWEAGRLRGWEATFHKASNYLKSLVVVSKLQLWFFLLTPQANSGPLPPLLNTFPTQGYSETPLVRSTKIMVSLFQTWQKIDKMETMSRQYSNRTIHQINYLTFFLQYAPNTRHTHVRKSIFHISILKLIITCFMIRLSLAKTTNTTNKQSQQGQQRQQSNQGLRHYKA